MPISRALQVAVLNRAGLKDENSTALSFKLFAETESITAVEIMKAKMERRSIRLCLLVEAKPCDCVAFSPGSTVHETQTGVIGTFHTALSSACVPQNDFYSFAVEAEVGEEGQSEVSAPLYVAPPGSAQRNQLSLVLPLTIQDTERALVLLKTLQKVPENVVYEMLIFCPDEQIPEIHSVIDKYLSNPSQQKDGMAFPLRILEESSLFSDGIPAEADTYGLQMAVKLLASRRVYTPFYLTLDADCVLLKPQLLFAVLRPGGVALFEDESRETHPLWWQGSAGLLGTPPGHQPLTALDNSPRSGFGVTPSIISTFGAQITTRDVLKRVDRCFPPSSWPLEWTWLLHFGRPYQGGGQEMCWQKGENVIWSEYTLYRLAMDRRRLFSLLHTPAMQPRDAEKALGSHSQGGIADVAGGKKAVDSTIIDESAPALHCYDVWYNGDLPWPAQAALSAQTSCLFSVVQSSSRVEPAEIMKQLKEQHYVG